MQSRFVWGAVLCFALSAAVPAAAQTVPDRGMSAVGVSIGVGAPGDDRLSNGLTVAAFGEHYLSPRVSVRGLLSGAWWDIIAAGDHNNVSPVSAQGNLVYNWERGKWHPYATAGLGLYKFRFTEDDIDSSKTTVGFNLGGGVEYFVRLRDTVVMEVLVHPLVGDVESRFSSYTPWYWTISGGYKKYF